MKNFFKLLLGLLVGIGIGLLIAALIIVLFMGGSFREFFSDMMSMKWMEIGLAIIVSLTAFIVSQALLATIHEAGHLVGGLLTGYKFVSFRVFSFTLIKENGRIRVKRFKVQGTGGQCLLEPPHRSLDTTPVALYIAGGVLANILVLLLALPLTMLRIGPGFFAALWVFIFTDVIYIILNGIPMRVNGICNDAMDLIELRKYPLSKLGMLRQLRANKLIQEGVRPRNLPAELTEVPDGVDYSKALQVALPLMECARILDEENYVRALECYEEVYRHKDVIMPLYLKEICCELVYLYLILEREEDARALLDKPLESYIESQRGVASSKERVACAIAYFLEKDPEKAVSIYQKLETRKHEYLLLGEVKSDLALMHSFLFREE